MRTAKQQKFDKFRAKDNASKYHWDRMTKAEKDWLIAFEVSEYEAERGHISDAVDALINVGTVPSDKYVEGMRERRNAAINENPQRAQSAVARESKRYKTNQKRTANMYDSSDYVRVMRGPVDEDDLGVEFAYSKEEVYDLAFGIKKETSPDNVAVMVNPEDGMIEAIDQARSKSRSLEKLIEDAKLSKEAKAALLAKTQGFTYAGTTYSKHANLILDMEYILRGQDGLLWVQDQHGRLQSLALYLKRRTSESIITHADASYPNQQLQIWVFKPGHRSDVEGKAVQYEGV
jgi:hypothetical protein